MKILIGVLIVVMAMTAFGQKKIYQIKDNKGNVIMETSDVLVLETIVIPPPQVYQLTSGSADTLRDLIMKILPKHRLPFYSIEWDTPSELSVRAGRITLNKTEKGNEKLIIDSYSKAWLESKYPGIIDLYTTKAMACSTKATTRHY